MGDPWRQYTMSSQAGGPRTITGIRTHPSPSVTVGCTAWTSFGHIVYLRVRAPYFAVK